MYVFSMDKNKAPVGKLFAYDLKVGDIARVTDRAYKDSILLRTYAGLVDLKQPSSTWGVDASENLPPLEVELLVPGESVTLTVK